MCSKILVSGGDYLAKTIPMIITNNNILIKDKESDEFKTFTMPALSVVPNIPFYHQFAERIAECQYYFKEFMKTIYGKKLSKHIFAIIVPDDTSKLESIFINEFLLIPMLARLLRKCLWLWQFQKMKINMFLFPSQTEILSLNMSEITKV